MHMHLGIVISLTPAFFFHLVSPLRHITDLTAGFFLANRTLSCDSPNSSYSIPCPLKGDAVLAVYSYGEHSVARVGGLLTIGIALQLIIVLMISCRVLLSSRF